MSERPFTPTPEQLEAITHPLTPLFIVAGAGAGKTSVMAERILWLVQDGRATADEILALTFTNKAAFNLKEKVRQRLGADADVTVATYHSFGQMVIADHALELDLAPGTTLLNRAQAWQLLYSVFDDLRFDRRKTLSPRILLDDALALASRCADHLRTADEIAADCELIIKEGRWKMADKAVERQELARVVEAYEQRKREHDLIDYGDQIRLAVRLMQDNPDVANAARQQHPIVLLDEYQDTNFAQRRLLQLIYPSGSAVTAVGDDMQSIYAFRGAHLVNVQRFGEHFPPAAELPLQTTFRFGERLTRLANLIQAEVDDALTKELRPAPGVPDTVIECFLAADDAEEAATIADDIASSRRSWGDSAVLCRKRRLIPAIVAALEERDIPVEVVGASGLMVRPEIVDLVAWLEVVADASASVALLRLLEGPRFRVGPHDLAAVARHVRDEGGREAVLAEGLPDLDAVVGLSYEGRRRIMDFADERRRLAALAARLPVLDLAETIVQRTGLWQAAGERGRQNLLRFLDLAERFAPVEGDPGLPAFLEHLRLIDESEEDVAEAHPSDVDAVKVMTIHQAKGLEYPCVYVPGLAGKRLSRIFPDQQRGGENPLTSGAALPWWLQEDDLGIPDWRDVKSDKVIGEIFSARKLAEEWRLFYVACTRAQERLVCSAAQWYPGPAEPQGPSIFYEFLLRHPDLVTERFHHDPPTVDPDVAAKERNREAALRRYARRAVATDEPRLLRDDELPPAAPARTAPTALSVTSLVSYARCPKQFYWSVVRPLPRQSSAAARLGTEVHRWIEQRAGRQLALLEPEADVDLDPDAVPTGVDVRTALQRSFLESPYADLDPVRVEAPFVVVVGGRMVRGRIDAVYERDGRTELVDFKTGSRPDPGDASARTQLDLYGMAAVDTWSVDPGVLRTTYCYLRTEGPAEIDAVDWDAELLGEVRGRLGRALDGLTLGRYPTAAGPWCRRCDFVAFCPSGQAAVDDLR
ncbi:MAG TPA: ATP-dependent DNA helicase [Acidimicrobiales bacterium]|jgi:DNA helicase-2/ATP-dependent DNA helicase PcrA|nr:ATP-dependent DNA helicase [Acidimicrobiales bacterium]